jgi:hypothetical protein
VSTAKLALASAILLAALAPASAQSIHTWVSGTGDDVNPCTRTAPCKTFAGTVSKTATGGLVSVIEPGGFGQATLMRGINIVADGAAASVLSTTNGITVSAGPSDDVVLSGLTILGLSAAQIGIRVVSGRSVTIRDCVIRGFQTAGISVEGAVNVFVSNCTVSGNGSGALAKAGKLFLSRVDLANNAGSGTRADGAGAAIELNASTVTNNAGAAFDSVNGGTITTFGNNAVFGNNPDGKPTQQLPLL